MLLSAVVVVGASLAQSERSRLISSLDVFYYTTKWYGPAHENPYPSVVLQTSIAIASPKGRQTGLEWPSVDRKRSPEVPVWRSWPESSATFLKSRGVCKSDRISDKGLKGDEQPNNKGVVSWWAGKG